MKQGPVKGQGFPKQEKNHEESQTSPFARKLPVQKNYFMCGCKFFPREQTKKASLEGRLKIHLRNTMKARGTNFFEAEQTVKTCLKKKIP